MKCDTDFVNKHQIENFERISKVIEHKQLLIHGVATRFFYSHFTLYSAA